ncbi:hypothetical protein [Actinacidiphila yeochonensis]|uniref:hypothetical protein n=1 Tax=Actinacidiphila yeochonensis TaxID=89050 RepID=UPI0012FE9C8C|nr:hypothetical protein [Actinacidiphila yeochonensis]
MLLITFSEQNFEDLQEAAYDSIYRRRARPIRHITLSQTVHIQNKEQAALERSTRSRGFLYAATAVRAAAAEGAPVAHIPENGQLAINPPLSPGRAAACSTRSVHPWTLHLLNQLIAAVAGGSVVQVQNPLVHLTKRQVCQSARNVGLSAADLAASLSCGTPPQRRPGRPPTSPTAVCATRAWCVAQACSVLTTPRMGQTPGREVSAGTSRSIGVP